MTQHEPRESTELDVSPAASQAAADPLKAYVPPTFQKIASSDTRTASGSAPDGGLSSS
jgi:hypothetical protein